MASKSDYYTHVMDIPPQYGPGYFSNGDISNAPFAAEIDGRDGSWTLPLPPLSSSAVEPVRAANDPGDVEARHEAAVKIILNHEAIVRFALRGAGKCGVKSFQAPLADPYATPNLDYVGEVDALLRYTVHTLLNGHESVEPIVISDQIDEKTRQDLYKSLGYLQARVGVPRDMSYPAARQLRAHLGWLMNQL